MGKVAEIVGQSLLALAGQQRPPSRPRQPLLAVSDAEAGLLIGCLIRRQQNRTLRGVSENTGRRAAAQTRQAGQPSRSEHDQVRVVLLQMTQKLNGRYAAQDLVAYVCSHRSERHRRGLDGLLDSGATIVNTDNGHDQLVDPPLLRGATKMHRLRETWSTRAMTNRSADRESASRGSSSHVRWMTSSIRESDKARRGLAGCHS